MRLTILTCGVIRTWRHLLMGAHHAPERIDVPVPVFVIEHDDKLILFDAGQRRRTAPDPDADFVTLMTEQDSLTNQLRINGFSSRQVTHVILSHTHADHVEGLAEIGEAECFIQQKETETPGGIKLMENFPEKKWRILNGRTDIFNDGRIIAFPTYGHTAGHQSLLLTMDDKKQVCLTGDALYMDAALDDEREICRSSAEVISCFRKMRSSGIRVISGHDPVSFVVHQKYFNH